MHSGVVMGVHRIVGRLLLILVVVVGALPMITASAVTQPPGAVYVNACQRASGPMDEGNYTISAVADAFEIEQNVPLSPTLSTGDITWYRWDTSGRYRSWRSNSYVTLTCHGDLQLWHSPTVMLWHTGTSGSGAAHLLLNAKGEIFLYTADWSRIVWRSWSGQRDLVAGSVLPSGGRLVSGGVDHHNYILRTLVMQRDGNLEYRIGGVLRWQTNTHVAGSHAALNTHAQLVVISPSGRLLWSSRLTASKLSVLDVEFMRIVTFISGAGHTMWQAPGVY